MVNNPPWLTIVGIGEDGVEGLSAAARAVLSAAEIVAGGARHLALAAPLITHADRFPWPSPITEALPIAAGWAGRPAVVLASQDPFCFGIGSLLRRVVPWEEMRSLPLASSFTLAANRLGWAFQETATISFCGRPLEAIRPLLQPGARILALSADATTPGLLAALLARWGFGESRITVLEQIGGSEEYSFKFKCSSGFHDPISDLNLMAIEVAGGPCLPLTPGLDEEWFETDGQITKREVRALTLAALAPQRGELLWDIGAGSGSIGIEWMLRHPANRALAVERQAERAARIARNAASLGVPGLMLRPGAAPDVLHGCPAPEAVFIGGGASNSAITEACWMALKPHGRFVVNAVTLEAERAVMDCHARWGGRLTRIGIERLAQIGAMQGFTPARTVLQYRAIKP